MDIVYILSGGSRWYNYEIRYSVRSILKHCKDIGNIYVVGQDPEFFTDDIKILPYPDAFHAQRNIWDKVLHACKQPEISEDFLFVNDDHFILKDFETYPYLHDGEMRTKGWFKEMHRNPYYSIVKRTLTILDEFKKPSLYFDIHCPIVFNKRKFIELHALFQTYINTWNGVVMKSTYCNMYEIQGELTTDLKLKSKLPQSQIESLIKGRDFFSMADVGTLALKNVLDDLYPQKFAKFEIIT